MSLELDRSPHIWGITGNLGGGKTLTAVSFAVDAIMQGYFVCSNVTLDVSRLEKRVGKFAASLYQHISLDDADFDPFKLPCGSPRGSGGGKRVLVIFDECAEWVDQYSNAKDPKIKRLWSWIRHSSKRSQDVFLIVQRPDYLNKVLRILVSRWVWVNDLAVWRLPVLKIRLPFMGGFVSRSVFDRQGNRIQAVTFASKSYWGQFYNTAECLNADGATYIAEYEVPRRPDRRKFWFGFLYLLSLLALWYVNFGHIRAFRAPRGVRLRAPRARVRARTGLVLYNNIAYTFKAFHGGLT